MELYKSLVEEVKNYTGSLELELTKGEENIVKQAKEILNNSDIYKTLMEDLYLLGVLFEGLEIILGGTYSGLTLELILISIVIIVMFYKDEKKIIESIRKDSNAIFEKIKTYIKDILNTYKELI